MRKKQIYSILAIVLILFATVLRAVFYVIDIELEIISIIRGIIHCGLVSLWIVSIKKRLIASKAKSYFLIVGYLILFWLTARSVKYIISQEFVTFAKYLWYLYYLPMIFIPIFALLSAFCINRWEDYVIPKVHYLLYIPASILFALIMTNDLHQWAFRNPVPVGDYERGPVYYITALWIFLMVSMWLFVMWKNSRIPNRGKRVFISFLPIVIGLVYAIADICAHNILVRYIGDMTAVLCLVFIATFEICIQYALVPSNIYYEKMFAKSSLLVQITDENLYTVYKSDKMSPASSALMTEAKAAPVVLPDNLRLSCKEISGGYVYWTEDLSELYNILYDLEDLNEVLRNKHTILAEEQDSRTKIQKLIKKDRLYHKMQSGSQATIDKLLSLIDEYSAVQGDADKIILAKIAVLVAYLKRRNNLIFIPKKKGYVNVSELSYCIKESIDNMRLLGAECNFNVALKEASLQFDVVIRFYEMFEAAAEAVMDGLSDFYCLVTEDDDFLYLRLNVVCDSDLQSLSQRGFWVERDDEQEWTLEYSHKKEGERQ